VEDMLHVRDVDELTSICGHLRSQLDMMKQVYHDQNEHMELQLEAFTTEAECVPPPPTKTKKTHKNTHKNTALLPPRAGCCCV
jgi:hypothetical protein